MLKFSFRRASNDTVIEIRQDLQLSESWSRLRAEFLLDSHVIHPLTSSFDFDWGVLSTLRRHSVLRSWGLCCMN